jgi:hypothetical protein
MGRLPGHLMLTEYREHATPDRETVQNRAQTGERQGNLLFLARNTSYGARAGLNISNGTATRNPHPFEDRPMSASPAQIAANQANSARSTGPKTPEGKARSRCNALKHGLTGEGVVLPNEDRAEVERRLAAFQDELKPSGEVGRALVHRAAVLSVRLDRSVSQETATLSGRVRQAEADFFAPAGLDAATVAQLRAEASARAMFDPSREATLARRYEAAAERGFFRALKELRQLERDAKVANPDVDDATIRETLGSFFQLEKKLDAFEARYPEPASMTPSRPSRLAEPASLSPIGDFADVPMTIGRRR